jgi:hypothetical protein
MPSVISHLQNLRDALNQRRLMPTTPFVTTFLQYRIYHFGDERDNGRSNGVRCQITQRAQIFEYCQFDGPRSDYFTTFFDLHSAKSFIKSWFDNSSRKEANNDAPNDLAGTPGPVRQWVIPD